MEQSEVYETLIALGLIMIIVSLLNVREVVTWEC
jgi:hypothetical protein